MDDTADREDVAPGLEIERHDPVDAPNEYLATAVVHFRVRGRNIADALDAAKGMFADALEASDLFGDGAVATVLPD